MSSTSSPPQSGSIDLTHSPPNTSTMVFPQIPPMSWDQLIEDRDRALEQTPVAGEQLPAYSEAVKGQKAVNVTEKELFLREQQKSNKSSSKMSTLKSILTGDVQKHNPRYVLEESLTGKPSAAREPKTSTPKSGSSLLSSSSTLKSILTGMYRQRDLF